MVLRVQKNAEYDVIVYFVVSGPAKQVLGIFCHVPLTLMINADK